MMGGMGRTFDGGYARVHVRARRPGHPVPLRTGLGDARRGARDAADRLRVADRRARRPARPDPPDPRRHLVGRHGHGSPRQGPRADRALDHPPARRAAALEAIGVDHVRSSTTARSRRTVRAIVPAASTRALELVGTPTLPDTLRATRVHGVVCFTGMLSNEWTVPRLLPDRLHAARGAADRVRRRRLRPAARRPAGLPRRRRRRPPRASRSTGRTRSTRSRRAHADMEAGNAGGKLVVLP